MLEKNISITNNRPDRLEITEGPKPWQWGGFDLSPAQVLLLLIFPFILAIGCSRRIVIDKVYQKISIRNKSLFPRKVKEIDYSHVENIVLSRRNFTPTSGSSSGIVYPLDLEELSFALMDTSTVKIATGYQGDAILREISSRIGELTAKPFEAEIPKKPS